MKKNNIIELGKIIITILMFVFLLQLVLATPNTLNIQGKLTDPSGNLKTGTFNFSFRIYDNFTSGNRLYESNNITTTTDSRGVYDIILANINITFDNQLYLEVKVNDDNEMEPRVNLTSVPYSFTSNRSKALNTTEDVYINNNVNLTAAGNIDASGNLTLGQKITFGLGELIDNLADGFLRITGNLNVTGTIHADKFTDGNVTITGGIVSADQIDVGGGFNSGGLTIQKDGNIVTQGDILFSGNVTVINVSHLRVNGSTVPSLDNTFDVGNATFRWRTGYIIDLVALGSINVGGSLNATSINVTGNAYFATISGNVGIGTTGPNDALEVVGNVRVSGSLNATSINTTGNAYFATISGNVGIGLTTPNDILEVIGNVRVSGSLNATSINVTGNAYFATSSGNVGIGTTTPGQTLHVVGKVNISQTLSVPVINTTREDQNITISSGNGSVIIQLG